MPRPKKRTPEVEEVRPSVEGVAKNLVDKLSGPAWGTRLTDLEDLLLDIREVLTAQMLAESLARQAAAHDQQAPAHRACPGCQQPLPCPDANPRLLATRAGQATWSEPAGSGDRCRRAFFPQAKSLGIDHSETSPALLQKIT